MNIDGKGNRVAAIVFGPREIIVIAGMNKVVDTLDEAVHRARTIAAPKNEQRFLGKTPCAQTGCCADCHGEECICNQILITRNCRPAGASMSSSSARSLASEQNWRKNRSLRFQSGGSVFLPRVTVCYVEQGIELLAACHQGIKAAAFADLAVFQNENFIIFPQQRPSSRCVTTMRVRPSMARMAALTE